MRLAGVIFALAGLPFASSARAAPRLPENDKVIVEKLPIRANDPQARQLRELRAAQSANPNDRDTAVKLARAYFDMVSAEGDPRYMGYAEAAIRPWTSLADPPTDIILMRALIRQYRHEFDPAMADFNTVITREPDNTEALQWQFAIHLVQADYAAARDRCARLAPLTTALAATACTAVIDGVTGHAHAAYAALSRAIVEHPPQNEDYRQWVLTRLGELALRMGDRSLAEKHFREAIATGVKDEFVLGAYSDLLLDQGRPADVVKLLADWTASDILLLRLAIAETAAKTPQAAEHTQAMGDRFAAAALRGDKLHQQEESRFELQLKKNAEKAMALALENWKLQREPRDARVIMEAALARRDAAAAKPALDWMASTGFEETHYRELAAQLRALPGAAKP